MKTLLSIIFILFAVTAFASPFLISDPNPGATSYQLTGWSETNVVAQADGSLRMDVGSAVQGTTYNLTIAAFPLFTEGAYMMVDMGGGIVYLKPLSVKIKGNVTTGNVEAA